MSKAQTRAQNRYIAKTYDRLNIVVPKGRKQDIDSYAKSTGDSVNGLINSMLQERLGLTEEQWKAPPGEKES